MERQLPVRTIIGAIADAAGAWRDRSLPARVSAVAAVAARTGYSPAVVEFAFDRLFEMLDAASIGGVIADELGSLDALDSFVERSARGRARALPIGHVCILSSRTTIGVAILPLLFALCAKCEVTVKDREDYLVAAFLDTLAAKLPALRPRAQAHAWRGESNGADLHRFDLVVAFGSDRTLAEISSALRFPARLVGYPAKTSAGYIARDTLDSTQSARAIARGAARDVLLYDGEGCLSLHALFIQRGGALSTETFCDVLREEIEGGLAAFGAKTSPQLRAGIAMRRDVAAFETLVAERLVTNAQSDYLLRVDAAREQPPLLIPRALEVRTVEDFSEAASYLASHRVSLEALAVAGIAEDCAGAAAALGASRITRFGQLQAPPLGAFHGGRPRIAEFVRWIVDER